MTDNSRKMMEAAKRVTGRYSPFRHVQDIVWKRRPIQLTFFVTRRCNAACPFCFALRSVEPAGNGSPELSLGEIRRISASIGPLLWLAFSGGEIFLRSDLADIASIFYRANRPAIMLFPTNGLLPEVIRDTVEKVLRTCPKSTIVVKLSLDGLGPDHDMLRNTPGSFERTLETYRLLAELIDDYPQFELGVNTVFCSENQDRMDAIIDFVAGLAKVTTHTLSLIRGDLVNGQYKNVDHEKYRRAIERLAKDLRGGSARTYRFRGGRLKAAQDILQRRLIYRTVQEQRRVIPCYAGRLNLVLRENGDVYPCEILQERFGNVRDHDHDLRKVMRSEEARKIIASIGASKCRCTHECYFMTNTLFNPRLYPALAREYLRLG
jgi:radical SAM protein with 4Fe4S-binding SPASM domain